LLWERLIALYAPGFLPFPESITLPTLPVPLKPLMIDPFIVPPAPVPITISIVPSPPRVYVIIKTWNTIIITPAPVIIL